MFVATEEYAFMQLAIAGNGILTSEVIVLKQRGTIRPTARERTEAWHRRAAERREDRDDGVWTVDVTEAPDTPEILDVLVIPHPSKKKRSVMLRPKLVDRLTHRKELLWNRFAKLPRFFKEADIDAKYQPLYKGAKRLFKNFTTKSSRQLPATLTRMAVLCRHARKAEGIIAERKSIPQKKPHKGALILSHESTFAECKELIAAHMTYNTVLMWMLPRSHVSIAGRMSATIKYVLDDALRKENVIRKERKLPQVAHRDVVVVGGRKGSHWRQFAMNTVHETLTMCEAYLLLYRNQGAVSVHKYKEAFEMGDVHNSNLQYLTPRHYVAAEVVLELLQGKESTTVRRS